MAKKITYFQFEPATYLTGSIQFCSLEAQGLYVNICCFYWQRQCDLTEENLYKKFDKRELISELIKENAIKIKKGNVIIDFLITQLEAITSCKLKLSEGGRKGGLKSATLKKEARLKHLDKMTVDEMTVDEIRQDINIDLTDQYFIDFENSEELETLCSRTHKTKEYYLGLMPAFKNVAELKYPNYGAFVRHFKNWAVKQNNKNERKMVH